MIILTELKLTQFCIKKQIIQKPDLQNETTR